MFHTPDAKNSKCFVPSMWRPENVSCPHFPENLWNVSYPPLGLKKRQNVSYPLLKPRNGQNVSYPVFGTTLKNSASKKYLFTGRSTCLICCSVTLQIFLSHSPYHCSYVSHTVHTKACILDSAIYIVRHTVMNKLWGLRSTWNCYNKVRVPGVLSLFYHRENLSLSEMSEPSLPIAHLIEALKGYPSEVPLVSMK